MAKQIIFLIHGMGKHPVGWSGDTQSLLRNCYGRYSGLPPFDEHFVFEEICYDQLFERRREQWKKDSAAVIARLVELKDPNKGAPLDVLEKVKELGMVGTEDNFATTHLLDVVFYRYLGLLRDNVRIHVASQIASKVLKSAAENTGSTRWSFIAHSLGTSVIHDTLHLMCSGSLPNDHLDPQNFGPRAGMFVANVSRLLRNEFSVYASWVKPDVGKTRGALDFYLNVHHQLDPFPRPQPFQPDNTWLDAVTLSQEFLRYQDIKISEIAEANIHDLDHYLENPGVHIAFFRALHKDEDAISRNDERKAVEEYRRKAPTLTGLRGELQSLLDHQGPRLSDLLDAAYKYHQIVIEE